MRNVCDRDRLRRRLRRSTVTSEDDRLPWQCFLDWSLDWLCQAIAEYSRLVTKWVEHYAEHFTDLKAAYLHDIRGGRHPDAATRAILEGGPCSDTACGDTLDGRAE